MSNPIPTHETIVTELLDIIRTNKQLDESFTRETPLVDVGIDSLTMVRILVGIEEKFGVWLEGDLLTPENLHNVESLARCLDKVLAEAPSSL